MTVFLSHSAWGAQAPNRQSPMRGETTHLFIHHSATGKPANIEDAKAQARAIQADHLARAVSASNSMLWADVAYGVMVGPGVILEGRGWDARSGATGPGNKVPHPSGSWDNVSASICVLGNYKDEQLDDATRSALVAAMAEARTRYGDLIVMGDRDVNATQCPGDNLYSLIPELWAEALGDDMALSDDDVNRIVEAVWSRQLDARGFQAPSAQMTATIYDEIRWPENLEARLVAAVVAEIKRLALIVDEGP